MSLDVSTLASMDDVELADRVSRGLDLASVDALVGYIGRANVVGPIIPSATLLRARDKNGLLFRGISQRLYGTGAVVDAVSRVFRGR